MTYKEAVARMGAYLVDDSAEYSDEIAETERLIDRVDRTAQMVMAQMTIISDMAWPEMAAESYDAAEALEAERQRRWN